MTSVDEFRYELPGDAIAQQPVEPRDAARLLDTRTMGDHTFAELPDLLSPGDLLVVNRTRVRKARLVGRKVPTGGRVELLVLSPLGDGRWEVLVRPAGRLRAGTRIDLDTAVVEVVGGPEEGRAEIAVVDGSLDAAIESRGEMPLPPYIHERLADPERYQTVYGTDEGSAAAPTAGLHFTPEVLDRVAERDIEVAAVTLEVGLDTFRPIASNDIADHTMHRERIEVDEETVAAVERARVGGGRVIAVGTTVVRALESAALDGTLRPWEGHTDLFITPGYRFRVVDALVTNFHVPGSTLVVLVAAFMGDRWRAVYETALDRGYRFLSFGDAMLAERTP